MRYRLVIFDFDGTLADSVPWFLRILNDVADRYRFRRIAEGELDALRRMSGRELMGYLGVAARKLPLIARHVRRLKRREGGAIPLFPGTAEMLHRLRDPGVPLALVTSESAENVRRILGPEHAAMFAHSECGASLFGKRACFRRVLRRADVRPSETLAVGDELRDLEAARSLGIPFGAVAWGYTAAEALAAPGPDEMFSGVDEIAAAVLG